MNHPYREDPVSTEAHVETHGEERVLYILLTVVGLIPIAIAWGSSARFGAQATIGGLMLVAGLLGLVRRATHSARR